MNKRFWAVGAFSMAGFLGAAPLGCTPDNNKPLEASVGEQAERWDRPDELTRFWPDLELRLEALPASGKAAATPWAGSYWPKYRDSINVRWDGEESDPASLKYEQAFGGQGLEDAVSRALGIDSSPSAAPCQVDSDCAHGQACGKRHGREKGACIPTWEGLCHGWAPASILEPEPLHEVTLHGVTFKVNDIKALLSLMYNESKNTFISRRCNLNDERDQLPVNEYGRPTDPECRDTNPGTFHLMMANFIGIQEKSFIADLIFDDQVWNFPLRSYRVLKQRSITPEEANGLLGVASEDGESRVISGESVGKNEWIAFGPFEVVPGTRFEAEVESQGEVRLFAHFGAEATAEGFSCKTSTPAMGGKACRLTVPEGEKEVYLGAEVAQAKVDFTLKLLLKGTLPRTFQFDPRAVDFVQVKTSLAYITESDMDENGALSDAIDDYTDSQPLEYILELDAWGQVIGGEWIGKYRTEHPDFLWLPLSPWRRTQVEGKISYPNVKTLLDLSLQPQPPTPTPTPTPGTGPF